MIANGKRAAQVSALALALALSGCGGASGGGGGLASTPPPPPAASYTKIVDMSGDRTFQTAGVRFVQAPSNGVTSPNTLALGNGVKVAYTAASDAYTLTGTDGSTVSFDPTNVVSTTTPNSLRWEKTAGSVHDSFSLTVPSVDGVALSYTIIGTWSHSDTSSNTPLQTLTRLAVGGAPTLASDMPRAGTATYSTAVSGLALRPGLAPSILANNSSATFSADFANNAVTTSLTLAGTPTLNGTTVTTFGTFSGTGTISTTGPGFSGTLSSPDVADAKGAFAGAFFGPKALEMGYAWYINALNLSIFGNAAGIKK